MIKWEGLIANGSTQRGLQVDWVTYLVVGMLLLTAVFFAIMGFVDWRKRHGSNKSK